MKKAVSLILVAAVCVSMFVFTTGITPAAIGGDPTLIVSEDFDAPTQQLVVMPQDPQPVLVPNGDGNALKIAGNDWEDTNELTASALGASMPIADFVWEFDFKPVNLDWTCEKFAFHTNGTDYSSAYNITVFGNAQPPSAVQAPGSILLFKGNAAAASSAGTPVSLINLPGGLKDAWYTIKVVMQHNAQGNVITVYAWEKGSPDAVSSLFYQETDPNYATSGGFTIRHGNTDVLLDNMKIWNTAAGEVSAEEYSNLYQPKVYTFDSNAQGLADAPAEDTAYSGGKLQLGPAQGASTAPWLQDGKLGDFIAVFDYTTTHDWANDTFKFRTEGESNEYNAYWVNIKGNANSDGATISIAQRKNGVNTVLATSSLSKSLNGATT